MVQQMLIGLLADTHIPEAARALPSQVAEVFHGVDLILHAGDVYIPSVLDQLERIAPVLAARGDDDYGDILRDKRVKWKHVIKLEGHTLWLLHEMFYERMVRPWPKNNPRARSQDETPDIVVFGHDHCTIVQRRNDVLFINPGSPTFLNYRSGLGTVAILDIEPHRAEVEIISLDDVRCDLT